ncbi:hypothetical protein [Streptomyces wuyuanensis]|uniref:hypothetical protein n=1 Tax=Streptomyces wuyuanensis TaxID=1196353 RepID=UPI00342A825C
MSNDDMKPTGNEKPYDNQNWAMVIKADPDHPLAPGSKDGRLLILIQNASNRRRKLHSHIGFTYRTSNTPGRVVFATPQPSDEALNVDTPVDGYFSIDGLPGDAVFVQIAHSDRPDTPLSFSDPEKATIKTIAHGQKVWSYLPNDGKGPWLEGEYYTVKAWAELEGQATAVTVRKFKANAPAPSITVLTPAKDKIQLSPTTKITGGYGGVIKAEHGIAVKYDNKGELAVRQDDPVKGTWTADPPQGGWAKGEHHITAKAENESGLHQEVTRTFTVVDVQPGHAIITSPKPMKPEDSPYSIYNLPHLQGRVAAWKQGDLGILGPCDKVIVVDPKQPEQEMVADLKYDEERETYTWTLETGWKFSEAGILHEVKAIACLGILRSDFSDSDCQTKFVMKTPRPQDNPLQFIYPLEGAPIVDKKKKIAGRAQAHTKEIAISEKTSTGVKLLALVNIKENDKQHSEDPVEWIWEPSSENWEEGDHTIIVTAGAPDQENTLHFTVVKPGPVITRPRDKGPFPRDIVLAGRVPPGADQKVTISDPNLSPSSFPWDVRSDDRVSFEFTPAGGWPVGPHQVTVKATHAGGQPYEREDQVEFDITDRSQNLRFTAPVSSKGPIHVEFPDADPTNVTIWDNKNELFCGNRSSKTTSFDFPDAEHPPKAPWTLPWAAGHHDIEIKWAPSGGGEKTDEFSFEIVAETGSRQFKSSFSSNQEGDYIWISNADGSHIVIKSGEAGSESTASSEGRSTVWVYKKGGEMAAAFGLQATLSGDKVDDVKISGAAPDDITVEWLNSECVIKWQH